MRRSGSPASDPLILAPTKQPLKNACAKNVTRFAVCDAISARTRFPVSRVSGERTKWNRTRAPPPEDPRQRRGLRRLDGLGRGRGLTDLK